MAKSKCFIIMPITTPEDVAGRYNDSDHFAHVLNCLFVPAVEKAELEPVRPIAKGSDLIHGRIINNLEKTDVVLCDMSILNPNVFFELGVRTALNKPVCMVRDDCTPKIPFDLTMINCHEYSGALNHWEVADQIDKLSKHLKASIKSSDGKNTLWQVFGMSSTGEPFEPKGGTEGKLEAMTMQIEALRSEVRGLSTSGSKVEPLLSGATSLEAFAKQIRLFFRNLNIKATTTMTGRNVIMVELNQDPTLNVWEEFRLRYSTALRTVDQIVFSDKDKNLLRYMP